ncbi:hypothetical protein [Sphingopyxis sp. PET50]|uniref:hypothetical protein n=1 Tax=Sphingopyxis sp. PET50 TaxID=2976533 RepID=UPI0021B03BD0|nr:hypothetical protein [Sphingopyxis sp. PET50]
MVDGKVDIKIFESLTAAQARLNQGRHQTYDGEFDSIAIFRVSGAKSVREAADAIRAADASKIELVDIQESFDATIAKLATKIEIDL